MSEFSSPYDFDYRNFNAVVREIFVHHANQLTGFDPEDGENLSEQGMAVDEQVKIYELAQQVAFDVRQLCQKSYQAEIRKQQPKQKKKPIAPLAAYALVVYERYVKQDMNLVKAMKLTSGKHSVYARSLYEALEGGI
jgi:hypothetical protein